MADDDRGTHGRLPSWVARSKWWILGLHEPDLELHRSGCASECFAGHLNEPVDGPDTTPDRRGLAAAGDVAD